MAEGAKDKVAVSRSEDDEEDAEVVVMMMMMVWTGRC